MLQPKMSDRKKKKKRWVTAGLTPKQRVYLGIARDWVHLLWQTIGISRVLGLVKTSPHSKQRPLVTRAYCRSCVWSLVETVSLCRCLIWNTADLRNSQGSFCRRSTLWRGSLSWPPGFLLVVYNKNDCSLVLATFTNVTTMLSCYKSF